MTLRIIFSALVLAAGLLVAAPAGAGDADYGRAWRADGVLKGGCNKYGFNYRVRPKSQDWAVEFFLVDPTGEGLGTIIKDDAIDPKRGRAKFKICRNTTQPGLFKIRGKLTIYKDEPFPGTGQTQTVKWIKPARFRLRAP